MQPIELDAPNDLTVSSALDYNSTRILYKDLPDVLANIQLGKFDIFDNVYIIPKGSQF